MSGFFSKYLSNGFGNPGADYGFRGFWFDSILGHLWSRDNLAPKIILGDKTGQVLEGDGTELLKTTGTLKFVDFDRGDSHVAEVEFVSTTDPSGIEYGTLEAAVSQDPQFAKLGEVGWEFSVNNADIAPLAEGEEVLQTYRITVIDEAGEADSRLVTVRLVGSDGSGGGEMLDILVPKDAMTNEDTALPFDAGIAVTAADPAASLTLVVTALNGKIGADTGDPADIGSSLTLSGTAAEINAQLADLSYRPDANYYGDETIKFELVDVDGVPIVSREVPVVIDPVNDPAEGAPAIVGTVQEGSTLIAETSNITDVEGVGVPEFQWQVSAPGGVWEDIPGATASTFAPTNEQVGLSLRVVTSFVDGEGTPESVMSAPTAAVAPVGGMTGPMLLQAGEDTPVDFKLSDLVAQDIAAGVPNPVVTEIAGVQLADLADGDPIQLASGAILVRQDADTFRYEPGDVFDALGDNQGTYDGFSYTVANDTGVESARQLAVKMDGANDGPEGMPTIVGDPVEGTALIANVFDVTDAEGIATVPALQWQAFANGEWQDIPDATGGTFTPGANQAGLMLRVQMTYTDGSGVEESVASVATTPVGGGTNNMAPVADDDSGSGPVDTPIVVNVLDGDFDPEGEAIDPASIRIDAADADSGGLTKTVQGQGTWQVDQVAGTINFMPIAGFTGPVDDITYTIADSQGARSDPATVSVTIEATGQVIEGTAVDGYLSGATVFADANNNGVNDPEEASATTDASGAFTVSGGSGALVLEGGVDIATLRNFEGQLRAPEGSSVVTPLTTLVVALMAQDASLTAEGASSMVRDAFGLDPAFDLLNTDPIAAELAGDPAAGDAIVAMATVQNTVTQAGAAVAAATSVTDQAGIDAAVNALAADIASSPGLVDLTQAETANSLVADAAMIAGAEATTAELLAAGSDDIIGQLNQAALDAGVTSGHELLTRVAQVSVVAQGNAADALAAAAAAGDPTAFDDAQTQFTGALLADAIDTAQVGDVDGAIGNEAPVIQEQMFVVNEESAPGAVIGTVLAEDAELQPLNYAITSGNDAGLFQIDEATGMLSLAAGVDDAEVGPYGLEITVSDGQDTGSAMVAVEVAAVPDQATGQPVILPLTPTVGTELTADLSGVADADGVPTDQAAFDYMWESFDGSTWAGIAGADGPAFTPTLEYADQQLRVTVSYTDGQGFPEVVMSDATDAVVALQDPGMIQDPIDPIQDPIQDPGTIQDPIQDPIDPIQDPIREQVIQDPADGMLHPAV